MTPNEQFLRSVLWRRLDEPGMETCELWQGAGGWTLRGTVLTQFDAEPAEVRYQVDCDEMWLTHAVHLTMRFRGLLEQRSLRVDLQRRWWLEDEATLALREIAAFRGLADIDLGVSPSTNTLPIRRLGLAVGERADVTAALIQFPDLTFGAFPQRYGHLEEEHYGFAALDSDFTAELHVDDLGLLTRYGDLWDRAAPGHDH